MNSFTLTAIGHLPRNPQLVVKGDLSLLRFCLIGNDYAGRDEQGEAREIVTCVCFIAFGAIAEAIARHTRTGDQLIVEAQLRAENHGEPRGERRQEHSYVVQGFRFGAPGRIKREEFLEAERPAAATAATEALRGAV